MGGLFGEVLGLCAEAGLVEVGVVAIDGTKRHTNASKDQNLGYEQIAREILAEADAVDREEDERYGEGQRPDVLPPEFRSSDGRRGWIREAKRRPWERREAEARPIPNSRPERLRECRRRLEEELAAERCAVARQDRVWAARVAAGKQPKARPPKAYVPPEQPVGEINVSDPDSRRLKGPRGYLQGYNAQAAVAEGQVVIAAEVNADAPDFGHLRTDGRCRPGRARAGRSLGHARGGGRRRRLLEPEAHGGRRQSRHPGFLLLGFGVGLSFVAVSVTAMSEIQSDRAGLASGLMTTAHELGGAFGVAIFSAVALGAGGSAGFVNGYSDGTLAGAAIAAALALTAAVAVPTFRPAAAQRVALH